MSIVRTYVSCSAVLLGLCQSASAAPNPEPMSLAPSFYVPIEERTLVSTNAARAVANGNVVAQFDMATFEPSFDENGEVERVRSQLGLHGAVTVEVRVEAEGDLSGDIELLAPTPLGVIVLSETSSVTPYAYVKMHYEVNAAASGVASVILPFNAGLRMQRRSGDPDVQFDEQARPQPQIGAPDAAASIDLELTFDVGVVFLMVVNGIPLGGPSIAQPTTLGLHLTALPQPAWSADITGELRAGWSFAPGEPLFSASAIEATHPLPGGTFGEGLRQLRWSRVYDLQESETSGGLAPLPDGGAMLLGTSHGWPWLARVDAGGQIVWQKSAVTENNETFAGNALNFMSDGELLASGWTSWSQQQGMRVERYDAAGEPRWARIMSATDRDVLGWNASTASADGGAILVGRISNSSGRN
jgi:hypothetical protein